MPKRHDSPNLPQSRNHQSSAAELSAARTDFRMETSLMFYVPSRVQRHPQVSTKSRNSETDIFAQRGLCRGVLCCEVCCAVL